MPTQEELNAKAEKPGQDAMRLHSFYRGKVQMTSKCSIRDLADFAIWYTPGVASPCKAIFREPETVYDYTNKGNSIAVVSDGTRVLGLGRIGPEAGLPVMEGKALLFKYLGGVDAVPICLRTEDPEEIIRTVRILEPSFGGINLEDICQPKCFRILDALRGEMGIPVWHDDQQGSATAVLAGLINALQLVGKKLRKIRIAMIGIGAANYSTYRLLKVAGVDPAGVVACDSKGVLGMHRHDIEERQTEFAEKWLVCQESNSGRVTGGIAEALAGADVCLAFSHSGPGIINPEWIKRMAAKAVVFACANPVPEIWPWDARKAGAAIIATGRTDFPNQVNNSLVFPGIFRGVLDVRARTVTDEMAIAAATEVARFAAERGIKEDNILPRMDEWEVYPRTAVATAMKAQEQGVARLSKDRDSLYVEASRTIREARDSVQVLMREGLIRKAPEK
jgi:malate dehydrogenase (oxaloacetate-decarboxylating)